MRNPEYIHQTEETKKIFTVPVPFLALNNMIFYLPVRNAVFMAQCKLFRGPSRKKRAHS